MNEEKLQQLAAEARREYHRQWRAKNRDKIREKNRHYWEKKALEIMEQESGARDA